MYEIYNSPEFNPFGVSVPSYDFFSFLNDEIYYIATLENFQCDKFIKIDQDSHVLMFDNAGMSKFIFRWMNTGYKICSYDDPLYVLTLAFSAEENLFYVTMEQDANLPEQLWDVLSYNSGKTGYGISIRSAYTFPDTFLYLGCSSFKVSVSSNCADNTCLMLCPIADWITFGMASMQHLKWIYITDWDIQKSFNNYFYNMNINLAPENILNVNNLNLIVDQYGGNFTKLKFVDVTMDKVICETMAVCNALRISNRFYTLDNTDFFKLAVEFEISGLYKNAFKKMLVNAGFSLGLKNLSDISNSEGGWGGDPDKIGLCLTAHGANIKTIHIKDMPSLYSKTKKSENAVRLLDESIKDAAAAVISYNFDKLHQAVHTFTCMPENGKLRTFNRFSDHTIADNYLKEYANDTTREVYKSPSHALSFSNNARFYVGYLIS